MFLATDVLPRFAPSDLFTKNQRNFLKKNAKIYLLIIVYHIPDFEFHESRNSQILDLLRTSKPIEGFHT